MATGKMNNRQKMINVMYLVLLAILALNVSSEVLDAFLTLRGKLRSTVEETRVSTSSFVAQMRAEIDREITHQGKRDNEGLKDTLTHVRMRTLHTLSLLDQHIDTMEVLADYAPELGDYRRKDEQEANRRYWMGTDELANRRRGNGQAARLRDSLDTYFQFLHTLYQSQIVDDSFRQELMLTQDPASQLDPGKRWEAYTFDGPVIANLATLEALKVDVYRREKGLLDLFNTRLGVNVFVPDTVIPISAPMAREVVAGTSFRTRLFVGMSSRSVTPEFVSPMGQMALDPGGNSALLSIMADGRSVPAGQTEGRQRYRATIRVPKATGGYQDLVLEEEFVVRKPTVSITSAAIQRLYRDCGNVVNIDVPELGAQFAPQVVASQATVKQANDSRKKFLIVPTGTRTTLKVSSLNDGRSLEIDQLPFQVVSPPKPQIDLLVNQRPVTGMTAVPRNSRFALRISPDQEFAQALPRDARYGAESVEMLLQDGLGQPQRVALVSVAGKDLSQLTSLRLPRAVFDAQPGARLFIRVNGLYRLNYQGRRIPDDRFSEWERTFSMDLR
jgi:gliding motility-associated protein GldM